MKTQSPWALSVRPGGPPPALSVTGTIEPELTGAVRMPYQLGLRFSRMAAGAIKVTDSMTLNTKFGIQSHCQQIILLRWSRKLEIAGAY